MHRLCFGGSFNPIHNAHLICSTAAARAAGFARVVLIPSHQPLLKHAQYALASAEDRLKMLDLAISDVPRDGVEFEIDPIEINRRGPSYTIDTVEALRARGWESVDWLIGADQLLNLHRWHRFQDLMREAQFWVMARPGYVIDWSVIHEDARKLSAHVVTAPKLDISATLIRQRLAAGESIDDLVPAKVREYILERRLYIL
jgi:nicotinate-nucleotide adenylyltransferase